MSVQFVLGRAGSGKSEYVYRKILEEAAKAPEKNFFLFVPEQYTLTAQLKLLELSETKALFNVEALSFTRFARRVFNELGTGTLDVLEDTGKSLLISKILKEKNDSLSTLKNALTNQGGVEELKSLFSEFYQYGVKSEDLRKVFESDDVDPFFKKKGDDIITLFDAFQEEIDGRFFTAEEIPALLCEVIDSSLLVKNSEFYFDGYTGFTPVQYDVLEKMMKLSERLTFSFTLDRAAVSSGKSTDGNDKASSDDHNDVHSDGAIASKNIKETDLFYMSEQSIAQITKLCEFTGTKILPDIMMPSPAGRRFKEDSRLLWLEENFGLSTAKPFQRGQRRSTYDAQHHNNNVLRRNAAEFSKENEGAIPCKKAPCLSSSDLSISHLSDPRDEMEFVCSEISRLVRTGKYHYRDFAVLAAGTADYEDDAPHIFESYGIPYFMDSNVSIFFNPLLEFIESALRIVRFGFKSEDVINFMRTGLTDFDDDEIDLFDDYLFSAGYKGKKAYFEPFTLQPDGSSDEELAKVNEIRERLVEDGKLAAFAEALSSRKSSSSRNASKANNKKSGAVNPTDNSSIGTVNSKVSNEATLTYRTAATATYNLFTAYDVERKLYEKHLEFSDAGDQIHAKEYEQIFSKVIEVLDRMVRLLGDSPCTTDEFSDDLMMLLSAINVGVLPYSNDCVVFGDMERSRLSEIRVLFLVGCHDGNIPGSFGNGGLLSDSEREKLSSLDFHLAPTAREKAFIKKFYLYLALTRSSESLYISFTKKDKAGNSVLPSYLILDILKLFPDLSVQDVQKNAQDRIYSVETLIPYLSSDLREYAMQAGQRPASNVAEDKALKKSIGTSNEMFALINVLKNSQTENDLNISSAFYDGSVKPISTELLAETHTDEVTGEPVVRGSISSIQSYYTCPYQYFLKYELGLKEKEEYGFRSLDIGNIYHHVLQKYFDELYSEDFLKENKIPVIYSIPETKEIPDINAVPEEKMNEILVQCVEAEIQSLSEHFLFASASEAHIMDNVRKTIFQTVKQLTKQLKRGTYRPREFEYAFQNEILIPVSAGHEGIAEGEAAGQAIGRLFLYGQIDRIDTGIVKDGNNIFVRVIDYKTGNKTISESNVLGGLDLQLFTYLNEALKKVKEEEEIHAAKNRKEVRSIVPGGLYFSHVEDPILKAEDLGKDGVFIGQDAYENAVLKSYRMNGMTLDDIENAKVADEKLFEKADPFKTSPVNGIALAKGNTTLNQKCGSPKSLEYIESMMEKVSKEETDAAGNILKGHFEKFPYIKRSDDNTTTDNTGCQYCPYHDICLFDPSLKGNVYRNISNNNS